jgi:hypothetical protein
MYSPAFYLIRNSNITILKVYDITNKQTPWPESASEPYQPSGRRLSAKLVPTFEN